MSDNTALSIDFIERVDLADEFLDALGYARDVLTAVVEGDSEALGESAQYIYPKLRFIFLNAQRYIFASRFLRENDSVLDVPCGTGYGVVVLASGGNKVHGIDVDDYSIARARDMFKFPNVSFETGDMMTCRLDEVDFITCLDGLEHVEDDERLIQRFVAALSDRGILVVTVPINELQITGGQQNPWHFHNYDKGSLVELLNRYFSKVTLFGHDEMGSVSGEVFALDGVMAVCEV